MQNKSVFIVYTDKTTLKCDKEFDGKGVGAQREKEKRGWEDGGLADLIRLNDFQDDLVERLD